MYMLYYFKRLLLLLHFIVLMSLIHQVSSRKESIFRSGADLIVSDSHGSLNYILEAYKSSINDKIIQNKIASNYSQLKWFSYGYPRLITINGSAINSTPKGFFILTEMLSNRHRRLFRQEIKQQYSIDVHKEQIKDLTPASFECTMHLKCYEEFNLTGKVLDLHVLPYRVDFEWTDIGGMIDQPKQLQQQSRLSDKQCMESILKENDFNFACNLTLLTAKPTKLPFSKTFLLRTSNEQKKILFDESILERLSNIELNLKKLNSIMNITLNDEDANNLVISEEYDDEKEYNLNRTETKKLVASFVQTTTQEPIIKETKTLFGHNDGILCMALLLNGNLASGSNDNTLRIWNPMSGSLIHTLKGHYGFVLCIAVLNNGDLVSGSYDQTIKVWNIKDYFEIRTLKGHTGYVNSIAALTNNRVASGSYDKTIKIWNPSNGDLIKTLQAHKGPVDSLAVMPDGTLVSGGGYGDNNILIWNIDLTHVTYTLKAHLNGVKCLVFLANGSLLSCGGLGDPLINIWDTSNGIMIQSIITNLTTDITSLAVLSNGNLATASSDTIIRIWNAKSGKVVKTLESHTWVVTSLVLLKNGQLASGSLDKTIRIWGS